MHFVYLLRLSNDSYYVGQTTNVEARLKKHVKGDVKSTAKYQDKTLVWYGAFEDKSIAIEFEKYLKSSAGKAFRNSHLI
ncbi:MAG: GIY-YIG nuclease family protein [Candidatus Paceibacterota bacterium]